MKFPKVEDPTPLFYKFSRQENEIFNETLKLLASGFTYARYTPLLYYEGKMDERECQGQRNLAKFMKILMVKRLESSFHAFRLTLDRFTHSYARVITEFKKGNVYISKKHVGKIFDLLEQDDQDGIENLLEQEKAERLSAEDAIRQHKGGANDAYILKRLKAKEIRRYHGYTDDDEVYIRNVIQLLTDGSLPKPTTKKVAEALKREIEPLKVLGILRRDISPLFFQSTRAQQMQHSMMPREVILSSWVVGGTE